MRKIFMLIVVCLITQTSIYSQSTKKKVKKSNKLKISKEASQPKELKNSVNLKEIEWVSMTEAIAKNKKEPKKILIDFYTDWCGWCKRMDANTYTNPEIIKYINQNYYAVKFNAEKEQDIIYMDKNYTIQKNGNRGTHELAIKLLNGKLGYPSTTFLDKNMNLIQSISGYIEHPEMINVLSYFNLDFHKKMEYQKYKESLTQK